MLLRNSGDESVVAFLPNGTSLVTLNRPDSDLARGELSLHLSIGTFEPCGVVTDRNAIRFGDGIVVVSSGYWTDKEKFVQLQELVGFSPDGRFLAQLDASASGTFIDILSTTTSYSSQLNRFTPTLVRSEPQPSAPVPLFAFSPDGSFAFLWSPSSLVRAPTQSTDPSVVVERSVSSSSGFRFVGGADAVWGSEAGVYVWRAADPAPSLIAGFDSTVDSIVGVVGDEVYFTMGENTPGVHTDRISTMTGRRETVEQGEIGPILVASPDGNYGFVQAGPLEVVELASGRIIAKIDVCSSGLDQGLAPPLIPPPSFQAVFTPNSRRAVATRYACASAGGRMPYADVVTVDLATGMVQVLAEQAFSDQVYVLDDETIVFATPSSPALPTPASQFDLVTLTFDGQSRLLARGVDPYIAVMDRTIAFSRHGTPQETGVYTVTAP
jgi:hypothetical protein